MRSQRARVYSVSELTRRIRATLEDEFVQIWVEGEISNFKTYASGHSYFVLKDADAQINCVLFAGVRSGLSRSLRLADGRKVRIYGDLTLYAERGQYQLRVTRVEESGVGELMQRFEELKRKLQQEGLFDSERKLALPGLPRRIGVVTSPTGAVIHDMLNVLGRRYPNLEIRLAPVRVQGAGAAEEVAAAVRFFNTHMGAGSEWSADLLIVGRGGGSLEDLWAFNEEVVVRAVAESRIPVISAVGHEVDVTLCDFAADLRAPTPSAAAELAIRPKAEFEGEVAQYARALSQALRQSLNTLRARLAIVKGAGVMRQPQRMMEQRMQQVDTLNMRLEREVTQRVNGAREQLGRTQLRLELGRERMVQQTAARVRDGGAALVRVAGRQVERQRDRVSALERQLILLSPLAVLERGYSLTRTLDGKVVRSVDEVCNGTQLLTKVADGEIPSTVFKDTLF